MTGRVLKQQSNYFKSPYREKNKRFFLQPRRRRNLACLFLHGWILLKQNRIHHHYWIQIEEDELLSRCVKFLRLFFYALKLLLFYCIGA